MKSLESESKSSEQWSARTSMVREFGASLRRRWPIVLLAATLGAGLGFAATLTQPKLYTSDVSVVVSTGINDNLGLALSADNLAISKAKQYQVIASSRVVAERALALAQVNASPELAISRVSASSRLDTATINIRVAWASPQEAQALADAWSQALAQEVYNVENQQTPGSTQSSPAATASPTAGNGSSGSARPGAGESVIKIQPLVPANLPTGPSSPNVRLWAAIGLAIGLILGLLAIFIREIFDQRIRSAATLQEDFGQTVVGTVPVSSGVGEGRLVKSLGRSNMRDNFAVLEAFKELRTNLRFMNPDQPPRVIAVSSCLPGEGKSTVASNLAISIASSGQPVVLVDGDLRRPTVARTFNLLENIGLTDAVVGSAAVADLLQDVEGYPDLKILGSGPIPPNPSEILSSETMLRLMAELSQSHFVIIDAPPVISITDSAILAAQFDGVLLVVRAGSTTRDEFAKSLDSIQKVNGTVLGCVLNWVPTSKAEGSRYGYYGKSYYYTSTDQSEPVKTAKVRHWFSGMGRERKRAATATMKHAPKQSVEMRAEQLMSRSTSAE